MGLPENWSLVEEWLNMPNGNNTDSEPDSGKFTPKWPNIPVLRDYNTKPDADFWKNFPSRPLPEKPESAIDVDKLEVMIRERKDKMTSHEFARAEKAVDYLRNGAPSHQKSDLPCCFVKNASSTVKYGRQITDNIATWIGEGFAAGPFDEPPCENFRINPLLAVVQPDKVRPVLDVSSPKGSSFNDNVDGNETEKVYMASAKSFAQNVVECGRNAVMSKHDLVAAYKQIPCKIEDLRLQGFMWLGKYFVETRQVFGAKTSVCNYDILGATLKLIAQIDCNIPAHLVMRQVDDVPVISPADSGFTHEFSMRYKAVAQELNVKLAPDCSMNDKAFTCQVRGKVLGVIFDTTDCTWRLSDKKLWKTRDAIRKALQSEYSNIRDWQKLCGRLNDISQMCSFMKVFRHAILSCMEGIPSSAPADTLVFVSEDAKRDLAIWENFVNSDLKWLPISHEMVPAPIWCREFVSDAAGLSADADIRTGPGCGNVGFLEDGTIIFANQLIWPKEFIQTKVDEKGVRFGDKTTCLEMIGLMMPMLIAPELFKNQHVLFKVDCLGTVFGMHNKCSKGDKNASVFIRAAYLIAAYLGCTMHVEHLPRLSDWGAEVADRLSRRSTTISQDKKLLSAFRNRTVPDCLMQWFKEPEVDWTLPLRMLDSVKKLV